MRLFSIPTVETRRRLWRVAAPDAATAERALRAQLPAGSKIVASATPCDPAHDLSSAEQALARLLSTDYLPHGGTPQKLEDWVLRARAAGAGDDRAQANAALGPMGLRLDDHDCLWVGSAVSVPALALMFAGTTWAGQGLTAALRRVPGMRLCNMTFAGRRARAVGLPLTFVFAAQPINAPREVLQ